MTRKARKSLTAKITWLLLLSGLLLMIGIFVMYTAQGKSEGRRIISETLDFMSEQCLRYDNLIASSITEDQVSLLDNARALDTCLMERDAPADEAFLTQYAQDQRLTGIVLTDRNLQPVVSVCLDKMTVEDWEGILREDSLQEVLDYPLKQYLSSAEDGENRYDYVAISLSDNSGLLFCYKYQLGEIYDDSNRLDTLLSGYQLDMSGTILISDGETILSSNQDELQGKSIQEYPLLAHHGGELSAEAATIREGGTEYMAGASKCKTYFLYAFFPAKDIYRQRSMALAYMLILYILLALVVALLRQQEVKHSSRSKMDFLHRMSHDIRTPINGIRGMVQIGNSYPDDPTKQKEVRRKIWEASDFLIDFVNDVMDMTKLESGEMTIEEKPFNLKDLMNSLVSVMDAQAKEQGITLTVDRMEGTHWDLIGSAVQVRRIFVSVIGNAIKYNQENGSVTLSLREISPSDSGRATYEFVCQDTGVGMSPEFQKKMFEQFTQENVIGEVAHHGTGLGLAIVKGLVREMDGTIRCKSEPNVGTTFTITLPFAVSAEAVAPAEVPQPRSEEESQKSLEGVSILLVEDNELNMEIAEFLLEDEGATITEAWNGQEALDLFSQSEPGEYQIILMDMMMPVMDGETATKAIRALDRADAKTIPILALTANAFNEDVQMALDIGMNAYLTKPIDSDQLKTEIRRFCPSGACA